MTTDHDHVVVREERSSGMGPAIVAIVAVLAIAALVWFAMNSGVIGTNGGGGGDTVPVPSVVVPAPPDGE